MSDPNSLLGDAVAQSLLTSTAPARLAYSWTDGSPRVVPIWFHWNGTQVIMASPPPAPKLRAIHNHFTTGRQSAALMLTVQQHSASHEGDT